MTQHKKPTAYEMYLGNAHASMQVDDSMGDLFPKDESNAHDVKVSLDAKNNLENLIREGIQPGLDTRDWTRERTRDFAVKVKLADRFMDSAEALLKQNPTGMIDQAHHDNPKKFANNFVLIAPEKTGNEEFDKVKPYHEIAHGLFQAKDVLGQDPKRSDLVDYIHKTKGHVLKEVELRLKADHVHKDRIEAAMRGLAEIYETAKDPDQINNIAGFALNSSLGYVASHLDGSQRAEYTKAVLYAKAAKGDKAMRGLAKDLYKVAVTEFKSGKE